MLTPSKLSPCEGVYSMNEANCHKQKIFESLPLLFEPGTGWAYGGGVDWAGELVGWSFIGTLKFSDNTIQRR